MAATTKKKTGLKKKYIKLAGKKGFKEAWRLQKLSERKAKTARKKTIKKKATKKKVVKKAVRKKTIRKKSVRKKPVKKRVVKKTVKRKTYTKRKGPNMAKKKTTKRRRKRNGGGKMNIQKTLMDGAMAAAGAVGISAVANMVPIPDPRLKALIPIAGAIILPSLKIVKGDMGKALSMGMLTIGAISLLRQFAPQLPLLAGEDADYLDYVPGQDEEMAMLGLDDDDDDESLDEELMLGGESLEVAGESIDMFGEEDDFIFED